jgi:putative protein-disulfide isomerase
MNIPTLNYFYDPLCGWCYGAAPLLKILQDVDSIQLKMHGGGMMSGQNITPDFRRFAMSHDSRIEQLTGQPFGRDYSDGLLLDSDAVLDSVPPIAAILAAIDCGANGCDMLSALQNAHYVEGRKVSNKEVLLSVALKVGIDAGLFEASLDKQLSGLAQEHIKASRKQLALAGGTGFPTYALELEGELILLDASRYYGQPHKWKELVLSILS